MAKKELLSLVAASLLAATLVGCGSSCRPGTDCTKGTTVPDTNGTIAPDTPSVGAINITATAPVYVLESNILKGIVSFETSNGGVYTWNDTTQVAFTSNGGAADTNENGTADSEDPIAPDMKAKAGYANINPFTTLEANGLSLEEINSHYGIALETTNIDLSSADLSVYKAASKAILELAYTQGNPEGDKCNSTGCLFNPTQVAPCVPFELIVCDGDPNTTSGTDVIPETLKNTFATIDATDNKGAINLVLKSTMGIYTGFYTSDTNNEGNGTVNP